MAHESATELLARVLETLRGPGTESSGSALSVAGLIPLLSSLLGNAPAQSGFAGGRIDARSFGSNAVAGLALTASSSVTEMSSALGPVAAVLPGSLPLQVLGGWIGSLFRSGSETAAPEPEIYRQPQSISLDSGFLSSDKAIQAIDYDQTGTPRLVTSSSRPAANAPDALRPSVAAAPSIVINVQAMDSRSFLDHSGDIALAVREALLNSHPLGDYLVEG